MARRSGRGVILLLFLVMACGADRPPTAPSAPSVPAATPIPPPAPSPPPSSSTDALAGRYRLDLAIGADCGSVPESARNRTYTADVVPTGGTDYVVSLTGGSFLSGLICSLAPSRLGCNQFLLSHRDDVLRVELVNENDEGHGGHIVEEVPPDAWIEVIGSATGQLLDGRITATGTASVWYCPSNPGYPFPCGTYRSCQSGDLRLTFVRQ